MNNQFTYTLDQLSEASAWIIQRLKKNKIVVFDGEMGAGKTTLIKEVGKQLGIDQVINSPTFSIINEYISNNDVQIFHFDCYRINSLREAFDIGIPEYLDSGNYCFIEWAEKISPLLPDEYIKITISAGHDQKRTITMKEIN
jgi:tRNA threonylcarbamoyladenosine biosynthesis protein TsaE